MKKPNRKDYPPTDNGTIDFAIAVIDSLRDENIKLKELLQLSLDYLRGYEMSLDNNYRVGSLLNLQIQIEESLK